MSGNDIPPDHVHRGPGSLQAKDIHGAVVVEDAGVLAGAVAVDDAAGGVEGLGGDSRLLQRPGVGPGRDECGGSDQVFVAIVVDIGRDERLLQ